MSNPNQSQKPESPSERQRRLQDEAENRGDVLPAVTIDDDGKAVRKKPEEVRRGQDAKESSMFDHTAGEYKITVPKYEPAFVASKPLTDLTFRLTGEGQNQNQSDIKPKSKFKSRSKSRHAVKRF